MRLLYIAVHEQNKDWGAEHFLAKAFLSLGVDLVTIDYRKHRKDIIQRIKQVGDFDYFFLQRGDDFPIGILKSINRPKFFWASELVSRNRDQDRLLNSGLFEHVFVHTLACKRSIIEKGWLTEDKVTVLLNGFDPMSHYPIEGIKKDIDVLFIGNMLGRRRKWLDEIKRSCNLYEAVGIYGADMVQLVNRAKIVLNIHSEEYLDTETRLFESSNPQKQGMVNVNFPKQQNSKGKEYRLTLQAEEMEDTESVAVYITEKNSTESELKVNENAMTDKASVVKLNYKRFNVETFIVFLGIAVYLWTFIKFMYKLFR